MSRNHPTEKFLELEKLAMKNKLYEKLLEEKQQKRAALENARVLRQERTKALNLSIMQKMFGGKQINAS